MQGKGSEWIYFWNILAENGGGEKTKREIEENGSCWLWLSKDINKC